MRHYSSHIRPVGAIDDPATTEDEMRKMLSSALLALSVLGAIATAASATVFPFGDKTTSTQEPSPH